MYAFILQAASATYVTLTNIVAPVASRCPPTAVLFLDVHVGPENFIADSITQNVEMIQVSSFIITLSLIIVIVQV